VVSDERLVMALLAEGNPATEVAQEASMGVPAATYLATLEQRSSDMTQLETKKSPGPGRGIAWGIAGLAVILTIFGLYFAFNGDDGQVVDQTTVPTPTTVLVPEPETVIIPWGGPGPRAHLTVMLPDGWEVNDGWVVKGDMEFRADRMRLGASVVANIYSEPCNSTLLDPPVGPTVDDLATAFADAWGRNATTPTEVTLDGFVGKQMVLTVPVDVDFADCVSEHYMAWRDTGGGDRSFQGPGQIQESWIIDVEGERLLIEASYFPEITSENRAELQQVIKSIQIEPE
jgi:hypothetical protein